MSRLEEFDDVQLDVEFTQAGTRSNLTSNENIAISFGKISKWYEALVPTGGSSGQFLGWNSSGTAKWVDNPNTDTKVTSTLLAQSAAAATYLPTFVSAAGNSGVNIMNSFSFRHTVGTTSAVGNSRIVLGNATASGTANNEEGQIILYSSSTSYHTIKGSATASTVTHSLPTTGGTILNTGTTSFTQTLTSGTKVGSIKINGTSTDIYAPTNTNTTYTLTQDATDGHKITLTPSSGTAQTVTIPDNNTTYTLSGAYGSSSNTWVTTLTPSSGTATTSTVPTASTSVYGITKLSSATNSTSTALAATPSAVKSAYDLANGKSTVSFSASLTTGTKIGTITINGTGTDIYCETNTNTDTKVTDTVGTANTYYPAGGTSTSTATGTQVFDTSLKFIGTTGTTSAVGKAQLVLGNSTASGTANNKQGSLVVYGSTAYAHTIQGAPTAARTLTLPNKTGTVAVTSDIPTVNDATLTLKGAGTTVTTFTANASSAKSLDIVAGSNVTVTADATNSKISIASSHPTITKSTDTTSTASPAHGGTFTTVDSVTRDGNGHVTKINTKTVTLPADSNTDTKVTQSVTTTTDFRPILFGAKNSTDVSTLADTITGEAYTSTKMYAQPSTGLIFCTGRKINLVDIQTGSTKVAHITLQTLMTWLITTKTYIPSGQYCHVIIGTTWTYANNDILQVNIDGVNYEIQLAGVIIEFIGSATSYNAGMFRLLIHSSPAIHFTATSGYSKFPVSTIAEYTCNGSDYSPTWKKIWNSHPTYTSKSSGLYKITVDGTGHVSAATAVAKADITALGIPGSDTNTTYTIATGDSNGQIKVTPSSGSAYNVSVKGLGSAAYTASTSYVQTHVGANFNVAKSGYFAVMANENSDNPNSLLPTQNEWWHILSMSWNSYDSTNNSDVTNWVSQLAIPTYQNKLIGMKWRTNSSGGSALTRDDWVTVLDERNSPAFKAIAQRCVFFGKSDESDPAGWKRILTVPANGTSGKGINDIKLFVRRHYNNNTSESFSVHIINNYTDTPAIHVLHAMQSGKLCTKIRITKSSDGKFNHVEIYYNATKRNAITIQYNVIIPNELSNTAYNGPVYPADLTEISNISDTVTAQTTIDIPTNTAQGNLKNANGFWGMALPDGTDTDWIRTTSNGIIPYQSGGAGSGHGKLGTSSWYFSEAYIDTVHALKHYGWYGQKTNDTRQTTANLTCGGNGAMQLIIVSSSLTTGRPAADGYIMDFDWDNTGPYKAQLFIPNSAAYNSSLQWRSQTGSSDWSSAACAWRNVLDANNLEYMANHSTEFKRSFDLDMPMSPILRSTSFYNRANRFALIGADKIVIQYSSNNGSTWTDMAWDTTDDTTYNKSILFNDTINASVPIGPRDSSDRTTSMKTRIIVTVDDRDVMVDQFLFQLDSAYQKITVTLEASKVGSVDTFETLSSLTADQWDYQCCINTKGIRFRPSSGNYAKLRITLGYSNIDSNHKTSVSTVLGIAAYSGIYWGNNPLVNGSTGKSDIALYDRPYTWMNDGTMLIPEQLKIFSGNYGTFIRNDGTNTYFLLTHSGHAQTGSWNSLRPLYFSNSTGFVTMENGASISSSAYGALSIKRTNANNAGIKFYNNGSTYLGSLAIGTVNGTFHRFKTDDSTMYEIIDRSVVRNNTVLGTLGWTSSSADTVIPTVNTIAFWNGAYSGTSSNLTYCKQGAFGTIVTKSTTDYSKVSITRNLTSGTKVGTITIDGTATDIYCETNTNTDTKVTQTNTTTSADYRVLLSGNANDTTETTTGRKSTNLKFNPSTATLKIGDYVSGSTATKNGKLVFGNSSNVYTHTINTNADKLSNVSLTLNSTDGIMGTDALCYKGYESANLASDTVPGSLADISSLSNAVSFSGYLARFSYFTVLLCVGTDVTARTTVQVSAIAGYQSYQLIWGGAPNHSGGNLSITSGLVNITESSGTITLNFGKCASYWQFSSSSSTPTKGTTPNIHVLKVYGHCIRSNGYH